MPWGRPSTTVVLLGAAVAALAGCGGGEPSRAVPTPVVIPGSTVTIGTEPTPPTSTSPPSTSPPSTPPSSATPAGDPTSTAPTSAALTTDDLVAEVAHAMVAFQTVHLSVRLTPAGVDPSFAVEADHQFLQGNDYSAVVTSSGDGPVDVRRVGGTTYAAAGSDAGLAAVGPTDPRGGGLVGALPRWDVLADLKAELVSARGLAPGGPTHVGDTDVASYTFTVVAADVVASAVVPDDLTGTVDVVFSVDATGLPVRVAQRFRDSGEVVRTDYGDWGVPVAVTAP